MKFIELKDGIIGANEVTSFKYICDYFSEDVEEVTTERMLEFINDLKLKEGLKDSNIVLCIHLLNKIYKYIYNKYGIINDALYSNAIYGKLENLNCGGSI